MIITQNSNVFVISRYPSSVFVGDTYTYFAGMSLAVVGILGHFRYHYTIFISEAFVNHEFFLPIILI